ncbi:MAG: hypothetical protein ACI9J2_001381 [Saprospiraceae bacterium]|jgi:uncharacterized protein YqeY
MSMKDRIAADMKTAMREKDTVRLEAVRLLRAAIQRKEVDDQIQLDDNAVQVIVQKMVKQSCESIKQFGAGGREDLVGKESKSLAVIEEYLPAQLDESEVSKLVAEAIEKTGAAAQCDMGKVMGVLKKSLQGQADMGKVSALVKNALN